MKDYFINKDCKKTVFKIGDVVKLPSEDKRMTVVSVDNDKVQCVWLNNELRTQYHDFEAQVLVPASASNNSETLDRSLMEN